MTLQTRRFGPFVKGVVDGYNSALDTSGALRYARNAYADGVGRILARPGHQLAMTLKDDGGGPANVTSVLAVVPFGDGALAVAHSTVTQKFYLYRFDADLSGWYDGGAVFHANTNAQPVAVLWTAAASPAKVLIAEGLGVAYIAHNAPGAAFQARTYDLTNGLLDLKADLDGNATAAVTYFRGFVSFQQHLWGWGYGSEAAGDNDRPELLRFGIPNFATVTVGADKGWFLQPDLFTVGHRVRSARERVVGGVVAGEVLYIGTAYSLWPVTGFGRNSWDKSRVLDESYGFAGPLAAVDANGVLYYWSKRGPLRVAGLQKPEPLWDRLAVASRSITSPADIIAAFDDDRDQVVFLYRNSSSGRVSVLAAIDTVRDVVLGPDGDIGLGVACAGLVQPTGAAGPAGPPTAPSTSGIGSSVATGNLTPGDTTSATTTVWEYRRQGDTAWIVAAETPATQASFQFTGLSRGIAYEWRAKHVRNGQASTYLGPLPAQQFTTSNTLAAPSGCSIAVDAQDGGSVPITISWQNSGEVGVSTEVHFAGPLSPAPASGTLPAAQTVGPGVASVEYLVNKSGNYYAQVRHVLTGAEDSAYSNLASASVFVQSGGPL